METSIEKFQIMVNSLSVTITSITIDGELLKGSIFKHFELILSKDSRNQHLTAMTTAAIAILKRVWQSSTGIPAMHTLVKSVVPCLLLYEFKSRILLAETEMCIQTFKVKCLWKMLNFSSCITSSMSTCRAKSRT